IERDTDAHPVSEGTRHVQAGAELDRTAEVDVSIPVIGPYRESGSEPPSPCEVQIGPEARIGEEGLLGGAGDSECRNEAKPSRLAWSPRPPLEATFDPDPTGRMPAPDVGR